MYQVASLLLVLASVSHSLPQALWATLPSPSSLGSLWSPYLAVVQLDNATVAGRYLLKHSPYNGMKEILPIYGMTEEQVDEFLAATHYMIVNIDGEGMVTITNSIKGKPEEDFSLTYDQAEAGKKTIPNPLDEEDEVEYMSSVLSPNILQVSSTFKKSGLKELIHYSFTGTTASVSIQLQEKNQLYPKYSNSFFQKVDEEDNPVTPPVGYYLLG